MPRAKKNNPPVVPVAEPRLFKSNRIRDYNSVFNRLLRDERLSPNRAVLVGLLCQYFSYGKKNGKSGSMTPQEEKDKRFLFNIIVTQFGNPRNIQWVDSEDSGRDPTNRDNNEGTDLLRDVFAAAMDQEISK